MPKTKIIYQNKVIFDAVLQIHLYIFSGIKSKYHITIHNIVVYISYSDRNLNMCFKGNTVMILNTYSSMDIIK